MNISLKRFLRTGDLGTLPPGMTPQQVRDRLGEPDDIGGMSRKYRHPSIYLYGSVEIWFDRQAPYGMTGVFWEAGEKGAFRLSPSCEIEDWAFTPGMSRAEVEAYLRDNGLAFEHSDTLSISDTTTLALSSGVQITFSEDGGLHSVYALCDLRANVS